MCRLLFRARVNALCSAALVLLLWGSAGAPAHAEDPPYLVRLERLQPHEDVCVLVSRAGEYRLERLFRSKTEVFAGSLSSSGLRELVQMLQVDELRQLSQRQIQEPLIGETLDRFVLGIFRPEGTQNLLFSDPDTRKPFRNSLDPLLQWLDAVQQAQHSRIGDSAASHCMPGEPNPPPASLSNHDNQQASSNKYLVILQAEHIRARVERVCTIVYSSGHYRMEKSSQALGTGMKVAAFEDSLSEPEIEELRQILRVPELANLQHKNPASVPFREGDFTVLSIPRGTNVQSLVFSSVFGVVSSPKEPGGMTNLRRSVDDAEHVIEPLRKWIKTHVEARKTAPLAGATATNCAPAP